VFYGIKHASRVLREQGGGSIVNVASVAAFSGGKGPSVYASAKAAVLNLTQAVAAELAADRVRVNAVCPGAILTPLLPESEFITGQSLVVDGGLLAAGPGRTFAEELGLDPSLRGLVGVSHGSTSAPSVIHARLTTPDSATRPAGGS
jgi:short subunit dehydrogenase